MPLGKVISMSTVTKFSGSVAMLLLVAGGPEADVDTDAHDCGNDA